MVDKLVLNNHILASKKQVQKVKTVVINKLVQKIRKLKTLAEKTPTNKKLQLKIIKNVEVLSCAKKLKSVDILRKALINEKNPHTIITNGSSLPEEIAESILFATKQITEISNNIKNLLSLNDNINPGWQDKVSELSKKKQKQLRTEQKKELRQQRKERHQLTLKRSEWLEENLPQNLLNKDLNDETVEPKIITPAINDDSVEPEIITPAIENSNKLEIPQKLPKKLKENSKRERDIIKTEKPVKNSKKEVIKKEKPVRKNIKKEESESEPEIEVVKSVDPFFITQTGDNYLSTAFIDRVQPEPPNDGMVRKERRAYQYDGNQQKGRKNNYKTSKNLGLSKMRTIETNNNWNNKNINSNNFDDQAKSNGTLNEVHPSWACKQKQRGIKEFSGKKTIFDENEHSSHEMINEKKIHPSWEAKRKQNGINTFSGKKTIFESYEPSDNLNKKIEIKSETKEKMHPSWEAKQKLKPVISEFKGTKIKFDD